MKPLPYPPWVRVTLLIRSITSAVTRAGAIRVLRAVAVLVGALAPGCEGIPQGGLRSRAGDPAEPLPQGVQVSRCPRGSPGATVCCIIDVTMTPIKP
jgi:hypothetical protein